MKKWMAVAIIGMSLTATLPAQARDMKYMLPIQNALDSDTAKATLDPSIRLSFGPQTSGAVAQAITAVQSHGRMKAEKGNDVASCVASFVDGLKTLQNNAKSAGANAVVNIRSYFKNGPDVASTMEFECHAGSVYSHVMLKGDLVHISDK